MTGNIFLTKNAVLDSLCMFYPNQKKILILKYNIVNTKTNKIMLSIIKLLVESGTKIKTLFCTLDYNFLYRWLNL